MFNVIKLSQEVLKHEVIKWNLNGDVEFKISKNFEFQIGVQGIAMSMLRAFGESTGVMTLACDFLEPVSEEELLGSFFATPFGFSVARISTEINFEGGRPASLTFKKLIAVLYKNKKGEFGSGKSRSFISVDPKFPFPPSLEELFDSDDDYSFPKPSVLKILISRVSSEMGLDNLFRSKAVKPLISFIYETYRNTLEHGIPNDGIMGKRSTRAIIFEKIVVLKSAVESRNFPIELKKYIEVKCNEDANRNRLNLMCITIVDQGVGIQNTLPSKDIAETESDRLKRAFGAGSSRKNQGSISRGLGLNNVVLAAHELGAMIEVWSGNIAFVQDFSLSKDDKYPVIDFQENKSVLSGAKFGTCISIFIPEVDNADQKNLFPL